MRAEGGGFEVLSYHLNLQVTLPAVVDGLMVMVESEGFRRVVQLP